MQKPQMAPQCRAWQALPPPAAAHCTTSAASTSTACTHFPIFLVSPGACTQPHILQSITHACSQGGVIAQERLQQQEGKLQQQQREQQQQEVEQQQGEVAPLMCLDEKQKFLKRCRGRL